jgi:integrase
MALTTIYSLGLRLGEGLHLTPAHIDGERLVASVKDGKGGKDRTVPLPRPLLSRLRHYWRHERPQSATRYLFVPERGAGANGHLDETTLQKTGSEPL